MATSKPTGFLSADAPFWLEGNAAAGLPVCKPHYGLSAC